MQDVADQSAAPTTIGADLCAIFVSLELSRSTWLATSLSPGGGEKMSKHSVSAGDSANRVINAHLRAQASTARALSAIRTRIRHESGFAKRATECLSPPFAWEARDGMNRSHWSSFDRRRRPETLRTAIAMAFFWPTRTTSLLPRVTPA
jgi:hypothetical protein